MARLFAGRSLWLGMEDAFRLPRRERSDPLLLNLVGRLSSAAVEHRLAVLLERLPLEDLGEEVRGVLVGRDVKKVRFGQGKRDFEERRKRAVSNWYLNPRPCSRGKRLTLDRDSRDRGGC